ncbi:hypothetical protein Brsp02_05036 [Brucella sp. NBRC 113783]
MLSGGVTSPVHQADIGSKPSGDRIGADTRLSAPIDSANESVRVMLQGLVRLSEGTL